MAHVNDMEQHIRLHHLLQSGLEGRHQLVGQALDKAYRIRQNSLLLMGQIQLTGSRVKGREKLILGVNIGIGQSVQQGGLAGVGVTNEAHRGHAGLGAACAMQGAHIFNLADALLNKGNAVTDTAAVHLQLRFAGTTGTDTAA